MALRSDILYSMSERVGAHVLSVVLGLFLARLLAPDVFGLMAVFTFCTVVAEVVCDWGTTEACVRNADRTVGHYNVCYSVNISSALVCSLLIVVLFAFTQYVQYMSVYVLRLIPAALCAPGLAWLQANMQFKKIASVVIWSQALASVGAIILALYGCGIWALIFQGVSANVIKYLLLRWVADCPENHFYWDRRLIGEMFCWGVKVMVANVICRCYYYVVTYIVSVFSSMSMTGLFNRAVQYSFQPTESMAQGVAKVQLPAVAATECDVDGFRRLRKRFLMTITFGFLPVFVLLFVFAEYVVGLLLGEVWLGCVPYLRFMLVGAFFMAYTVVNNNMLIALGCANKAMWLNVVCKVTALVTCVLCACTSEQLEVPMSVSMVLAVAAVIESLVFAVVTATECSRFQPC